MGNVFSNCFIKRNNSSNDINSNHQRQPETSNANTGTKSLPLKREKIKWKTSAPMDRKSLLTKREEFWHTSPAFEGRQEIWDALKAAVQAIEVDDYELSQAIIVGANIILPRGLLSECFDELGNSYKLPPYVLSEPTNLIEIWTSNPNPELDPSTVGDQPTTSMSEAPHSSNAPQINSLKILIRFRLSSGQEFQESVSIDDTVYRAKIQLSQLFDCSPSQQKWFCYGKPLLDSILIKNCQIPAGFVVQVVIQKVNLSQMTNVE